MSPSRICRCLPLLVAGTLLAACTADHGQAVATTAARGTTPPYLAMARGQVDVQGGLIHVVAAHDGRIVKVTVEDGDTVKQGDILALLDQRQAQVGVAVAQANAAQAMAQVDVLKARLAPAQAQAARVHEAAAAGAATGQSADDAHAALALLNAEIAAARATVKVAHEHVDEAQIELAVRSITAPVAGKIVRRDAHVGDAVSAQAATEMFQILPDRPRIVRAELDEAYVDLVKPGMQAEVVRESDQGTAVPARVLRVGDVFGPSKLADDPVERVSAHDVECVLQLDGGDFRIGQRVLVRFRR